MKKFFWAMVLVAVICFCAWSKNPLDDAVNFIIGGSIPGTKASIGFWSTIAVAAFILIAIKSAFSSLKLQMLAHTAKEIKAEEAEKEFEDSNNFQFDRSKRSVIAARN